jgi:hypothetical protein
MQMNIVCMRQKQLLPNLQFNIIFKILNFYKDTINFTIILFAESMYLNQFKIVHSQKQWALASSK